MKTEKVSLREIMEDDNSPYMKNLVDKFMKQYGDELGKIIADSNKRVDSRMGRDSNLNRRRSTRCV